MVKYCVATLILILAVGCGGNAKPEVTVVRQGTTILDAVTAYQKGITAATDAGSLPVEVAQKLTGLNQVIHDKAVLLGASLSAYHSATSTDVSKMKAAEVVKFVGEMNNVVAEMLGVALPSSVMSSLTKLAGRVIEAIGLVQAEIAKGLTVRHIVMNGEVA